MADVIALTPEQLRPVPELHRGIVGEHLLAIGAVDKRTLMLLDIERRMSSPGMGLANRIEH